MWPFRLYLRLVIRIFNKTTKERLPSSVVSLFIRSSLSINRNTCTSRQKEETTIKHLWFLTVYLLALVLLLYAKKRTTKSTSTATKKCFLLFIAKTSARGTVRFQKAILLIINTYSCFPECAQRLWFISFLLFVSFAEISSVKKFNGNNSKTPFRVKSAVCRRFLTSTFSHLKTPQVQLASRFWTRNTERILLSNIFHENR